LYGKGVVAFFQLKGTFRGAGEPPSVRAQRILHQIKHSQNTLANIITKGNVMRYVTVLFVSLILAACNAGTVTRTELNSVSPIQGSTPGLQKGSIDSVVQFLIASAATDFRTYGPSPIGFRNVRIGHDINPNGEPRYILCGQFLRAQEGGKDEWVSFATIKTSGYEQWLGNSGFCKDSSFIWDTEGDLSSTLQSRYESQR
jgi:hypothetical protein